MVAKRRHVTQITLSSIFLHSSEKLCRSRPQLKRTITKTLTLLQNTPASPGLHREPIHNERVADLWSSRVNLEVRLIHQEPNVWTERAVNVGYHDPVYAWAERWSGQNADASEVWSECQPSLAQKDHQQAAPNFTISEYLPRAAAGDPSYSCIPLSELTALGLDEITAERIRLTSIDIALEGFGIPPTIVNALSALFGRYDRPLPRRVTSTQNDPLPVPRRHAHQDIVLSAPEQFERMVELGLDRYLTFITEDQREIAELDQKGLLVVKGSGGSGKTTVAVHRLKFLADRIAQQPSLFTSGPRRVIYLCFNSVLAETVRQMLTTLYGSRPPTTITVSTIDTWVKRYLEEQQLLGSAKQTPYRFIDYRSERILANLVQERALRTRNKRATLWTRFSSSFFAAEIADVIQGRGLTNRDEYLQADRAGRGTHLSEQERKLIWELAEDYRTALRETHTLDVREATSLALAHLAVNAHFTPYEAVIVDEGQDFTPVQLRLATQMAGKSLARLSIFADAAQVVYGTGFSWKQAELTPRGNQVRTLSRNHRNTLQIYQAAQCLLESGQHPDDPETYVTPQAPTESGPKPVILCCDGDALQYAEICQRIREQIRAGIAPQNIAVLCGKRMALERVANLLREAEIPVQIASPSTKISITHPSVKLLTMHSAKGLDFPHAYIGDVTRTGIPGGWAGTQDTDVREQQRRLLYVAMIRAGKTLVMTTIAGQEHPLLADLGPEVCDIESIRPASDIRSDPPR